MGVSLNSAVEDIVEIKNGRIRIEMDDSSFEVLRWILMVRG